jgi:hypothetical protein
MSEGHVRRVFVCRNCGKLSTLATSVQGKADNLPDPFQGECQWCHHKAEYIQADIKTVMDIGPAP